MGSMLSIPFLSTLYELVPHVDFEGQKFAERLFKYIILLFAAVGFAWGYICQQFSQTVYIFAAGFALACVLVLPPWPMFRRHPLQWLPSEDSKQSGRGSAGGGGNKLGKNDGTKQPKQEAKRKKKIYSDN